MPAPWENSSLHFMTIDSDFEELICIECKMSSLTWKLESPHVQTGPALCFHCKDRGNNERLCFLFQKILPALFCIFFYFFSSLVGLMTTGSFADIWAYGKIYPVWVLSSWVAEAAGFFLLLWSCCSAKVPDANILTPLRDSWKHDWHFILCREHQPFRSPHSCFGHKGSNALGTLWCIQEPWRLLTSFGRSHRNKSWYFSG